MGHNQGRITRRKKIGKLSCPMKPRAVMAGLDPAIHRLRKMRSLKMMDTPVKPAYDNFATAHRWWPASFRFRKPGRRFSGDLAERVRKCRDAGIAEIGSELLDRDIGLHRQFFDRRRDARALAPALEAQLRLR